MQMCIRDRIKGRYREDKLEDDHSLIDATYPVLRCIDGKLVEEQEMCIRDRCWTRPA